MEGRVPGGQRQGGADCRGMARGHFQVISRPAHYRNVSIGLGVLTDLRGPLALQVIPTVTSGARVIAFYVIVFHKIGICRRSFACFNNGLRVGWVYEVIVFSHSQMDER